LSATYPAASLVVARQHDRHDRELLDLRQPAFMRNQEGCWPIVACASSGVHRFAVARARGPGWRPGLLSQRTDAPRPKLTVGQQRLWRGKSPDESRVRERRASRAAYRSAR
jgi:hypothetical protein